MCHSLDEMTAILDRYAASGIKNVLALGGDPPKKIANFDRSKDAFQYADQLVNFIRSRTNAPTTAARTRRRTPTGSATRPASR